MENCKKINMQKMSEEIHKFVRCSGDNVNKITLGDGVLVFSHYAVTNWDCTAVFELFEDGCINLCLLKIDKSCFDNVSDTIIPKRVVFHSGIAANYLDVVGFIMNCRTRLMNVSK
jgi:hypothetical protein